MPDEPKRKMTCKRHLILMNWLGAMSYLNSDVFDYKNAGYWQCPICAEEDRKALERYVPVTGAAEKWEGGTK